MLDDPISMVIRDAQAAMLQRNQTASALLRLPAELRSEIYHHVLGFKRIRVVLSKGRAHTFTIKTRCTSTEPLGTWESPQHLLALTGVCRQIQLETSRLIFTLNEFDARHLYRFQDLVTALTPAQLNAITTLRVQVHDVCLEANSNETGPRSYIIRPACRQILHALSGLERVFVQEWTEWRENGYMEEMGLSSQLACKIIKMNARKEDMDLYVEDVSYDDPCENLGVKEESVLIRGGR
ncbi:hypothetical protein P153DRAFT_382355 [Dothidotthia symphoricarpi CBS 119687]|uniref:DUF7730 domain-containing protein n=1 Tax=Dothidotthia symphoricarpi CBS 119687 TaxID=1392245 RepID=A0A6A6ANG5_9PLEO|nr:uncharacterized protein P153DRAFT_382355 [Dothidotthia symphoricarpi CBS 119687]KAF2132733.1 hypothetical protein P153DRAFT_382355 [Dothidotthia symphoricarpi CBS 119687]